MASFASKEQRLVSGIYKMIYSVKKRRQPWQRHIQQSLKSLFIWSQDQKQTLLNNENSIPLIYGTLQNRNKIMNTFGAEVFHRDAGVFLLWKPCREPPLFPDLYYRTLFLFPNPSECEKQADSAGAYATQIISFVQFAIVSSMSG